MCDGPAPVKVRYIFISPRLLLPGCMRSVNITVFYIFESMLLFLVLTSEILRVQTCLTYQIKGGIPVYWNIIVLKLFSKENNYLFMKVKND